MAESKFSPAGLIAFISVIIYCITLSVLESLVIYFHVSFVDNFTLDSRGQGISISDLIYHGIFIASLLFQVILCINALLRKNSIQLASLVVFNILSLTYAGLQIYQHIILEEQGTKNAPFKSSERFPTYDDASGYYIGKMRPIEYIIAALVLIFSIYLGLLTMKLMKEFGWENYKLYTADLKVHKALDLLTKLQTLIKLDIFFIISYAVQLTPSKLMGYSDSMIETVLIFVVGSLMLVMAWYSVAREMKYVLLAVINLCSLALFYFVYRLVKINIPRDSNADPYLFTRKLITFTLCVVFALIFITIYYSILCFRNMRQGIYVFAVYGRPGSKHNLDQGLSVPFDENNQSRRYSQKVEFAQRRASQQPEAILD